MKEEYGKLFSEDSSIVSCRDRLAKIPKELQIEGWLAKFQDLEKAWQANNKWIQAKIDEPGKGIKLENTTELFNAVKKVIEDTNKEIDDHMRDQSSVMEKIKEKYWKIIRRKHYDAYKSYEARDAVLSKREKKLESIEKQLNRGITKEDEIITKAEKDLKTTNVAKERINNMLKEIGIVGFKLERETIGNAEYYQIDRPRDGEDQYRTPSEKEKIGNGEGQYPTLSEGEKTLIVLLYFLAACEGNPEPSESLHPERRLIVIDDPISSLSQEYVFDVASLIKSRLVDRGSTQRKYRSVIILTHSLYFFQELLRVTKDRERALYYLSKEAGVTEIEEISKGDIQHEYDLYWKRLRNYKKKLEERRRRRMSDDAEYKLTLAHTMRCILEYFFNFTAREELIDALRKGKVNEHFYRYMNSGSHSEPRWSVDPKRIEPNKWLTELKKVFRAAGYEDHYDRMIEEREKSSKTRPSDQVKNDQVTRSPRLTPGPASKEADESAK